ncbi:Piso0_003928 [Millerozyma farinosa CBS 7064]|uniref:Piso0_003928 protein n=1 Tax=Pichia sorbitophila (strain ATCC MYA-4447 / BCRC 22081 / CBS 7064 / NBRC 10061 / NRRL Y-12695) TaxID=559304 RepID=G8Y704_PICSO|nr:Piso0_003928 [Millerozyma farinosa CBS 7064]CCE84384.1 Piso0_003928 [Millerozyma farinosa CBS 7064]
MRHIKWIVDTGRTLPALRSRSSVSRNSSAHPKLSSNQQRCTDNHVFNPRFGCMQYASFDDHGVLPPLAVYKVKSWTFGTSFNNQRVFSLSEDLTSKKKDITLQEKIRKSVFLAEKLKIRIRIGTFQGKNKTLGKIFLLRQINRPCF